ncbi:Bifunctional chorismate mutase/prephenate dehydratase [Colletotrichum sidae]|uniref:prephenate dehydratase n=1 Tax=Colletotrichum sidae TaxID=1347389 RepID=A0A4R8S791_9PEZI|nr:Bifunctional chorismate mutase/prephenate dehydratase [Colletotrichum sidae]
MDNTDNFCFPLGEVANDRVKLTPFRADRHAAKYIESTSGQPELYAHTVSGPYKDVEDFVKTFVEGESQADPGMFTFAIIDKTRPASAEDDEGELAGRISFANTSKAHLCTEVGYIMIFPDYQRTHVTTNAVGLMLQKAFATTEGGGFGIRKVLWQAHAHPGNRGSATLHAFPEDQWDLRPVVTITDVFEVVQAGEVAFGVVPVENSTNGSVLFTLDNFADRNGLYPDISVCGEIYLDVHHFLVGHRPPGADAGAATGTPGGGPPLDDAPSSGPGSGACTPTASDPNPLKPRAKPLCSLKHVRRLYSHPQAWGQCVAFLQTYLKGIEAIDVSSTSRAAELVAMDESGTSAAISSEIAARMHGIDVLARSIEDREDNTTRFFIIRKGAGGGGPPAGSEGEVPLPDHCGRKRGRTKSMVSFTVPHEAPGALAGVLECFRKFGLNLTSINSRPSLTAPFNYVFFVEFEGHRLQDPEGRVRGALEGVAEVAERWRWLGSWEDQRS